MNLDLRKSAESDKSYWVACGEDSEFKCSICDFQIKNEQNCFICENNHTKYIDAFGKIQEGERLILCPKCQDKFDMIKCRHDQKGEHKHIKVIRE